MDIDKIRGFLNDVSIGNYIQVNYISGESCIIDRKQGIHSVIKNFQTIAGYISQLDGRFVKLSRNDPILNEKVNSLEQIAIEGIENYKVLEDPQLSKNKELGNA